MDARGAILSLFLFSFDIIFLGQVYTHTHTMPPSMAVYLIAWCIFIYSNFISLIITTPLKTRRAKETKVHTTFLLSLSLPMRLLLPLPNSIYILLTQIFFLPLLTAHHTHTNIESIFAPFSLPRSFVFCFSPNFDSFFYLPFSHSSTRFFHLTHRPLIHHFLFSFFQCYNIAFNVRYWILFAV